MSLQQVVPATTPSFTDEYNTDASVAPVMSRVPTALTACQSCRSKHLKCDGSCPCTRCVAAGRHCSYVASRRGRRPSRRDETVKSNKRHASSPLGISRDAESPALLLNDSEFAMEDIFGSTASPDTTMDAQQTNATSTLLNMQTFDFFNDVGQRNSEPSSDLSRPKDNALVEGSYRQALDERCFEAFYYFFFASQPFILPRESFLQVSKHRNLSVVSAAMRWIGSLFVELSAVERDRFYCEAMREADDADTPRDGFLLQALMLLIIGLDGQCHQKKSRDLMADAQNLALEIEINTRPYAAAHGHGDPTLTESWRRTWWNLYVTDAMVSGVHRIANFALFDVSADVEIPCEEEEYLSGSIPRSVTLEDLLDAEFSDMEGSFSSFAYRILSCRNLGQFMRTPPIISANDENIARLEAQLTNWRMHLPHSKVDALQKDGSVDEMMFQGQMMTHATSILLHQPHSRLDTTPTEDINSCAPHPGTRASREVFNSHTKQTVVSAGAISDLITLRAPLNHHTHFFSCVITLSSIVHLSRWALYYGCNNGDLQQQIRLNIGGLKQLSRVWSSAGAAREQVKAVARGIFREKRQQQNLLDASFNIDTIQENRIQMLPIEEFTSEQVGL